MTVGEEADRSCHLLNIASADAAERMRASSSDIALLPAAARAAKIGPVVEDHRARDPWKARSTMPARLEAVLAPLIVRRRGSRRAGGAGQRADGAATLPVDQDDPDRVAAIAAAARHGMPLVSRIAGGGNGPGLAGHDAGRGGARAGRFGTDDAPPALVAGGSIASPTPPGRPARP